MQKYMLNILIIYDKYLLFVFKSHEYKFPNVLVLLCCQFIASTCFQKFPQWHSALLILLLLGAPIADTGV